MPDIIISDTSCLIVLAKIGELELLKKLYGSIITTEDIAKEFGEELPNWIEVKQINDYFKQRILEMHR